MKRSTLYALPLAVGVVVALTLAQTQPRAHGSNLAVPEGGTFRISLAAGSGIDYIDPALAYTPAAWALLDTVCARLLAYPDKRPPASFRARARSGGRVAEGLARPAHVHVHVAHRLSLQRRHPGSRECVRPCDQPDARTGGGSPGVQLTRETSSAPPTCWRGERGPRRQASSPRGTRSSSGSRGRCPTSRLGRRAVLLRGAADAAVGPRGLRRLPGRRAVLRRRVQAGRTRRDPAATASTAGSRPHHVDGFDVDLRASSPQEMLTACQAGRRRLGPHRRRASTSIRRLRSSPATASIAPGSSSSPA